MAVSFGFDCLVFMGQVLVFNGEDRNYLIAFWDQKFEDRTTWDTDDEAKEKYVKALGNGQTKFKNREEKQQCIDNWKPPRAKWCEFVFVCLCLAWSWMGA